ncbi:hypothetical protein SPI_09056 [Niveomyces insectorum RCEF 264]|uniref:DUF7729 domain-containing protein n=1 Tax=Niveomyces insectorum RCEF 264 TaxID=1081102 RepID=A0A167MA19_9HYPO|nr:hypothetical protein SPI_09056 [Niveomyces insectorum RCEF 264]
MVSASQHHKPRIHRRCAAVVVLLGCLASLLPTAAAGAAAGAADRVLVAPTTLVIPFAAHSAAAGVGPLLRDERVPMMQDGQWTFLSQDDANELRRRDDIGTAVTTAPAETTATTKTTAVPSSPLPKPFDSSLASNFSDNCPSFINSFLTDPTFKSCYPFSLLLQGSRSFFEAAKSVVTITQVLDATCAANVTFCTNYLANVAANLTEPTNCGEDYAMGNSIVVEAYLGMVSYQPLYIASCLKDPESGLYCYANAVTNLTTPSNVYFYYLPLNISLPGSSIPSCNWCLQQTMAGFQAAAANRKQPIASTYVSAAQQVDTVCGPAFVNDTLPVSIKSTGFSLSYQGGLPLWLAPSLLVGVAAHLLLL